MQRLLLILFWSVIAAAFIGPGTVTACASAGSGYGYALLWALIFSTFACFVLQEASARVTVLSGMPLAEAIRNRGRTDLARWTGSVLVLGAILLGCAAYEAGNILGAVSGALLAGTGHGGWLTVAIVLTAFVLLWFGTTGIVARIMGAVVAVMAVAFLATAFLLFPAPRELLLGAVIPTIPAGSSLLVLGLVGTTVVPYNLFLGSGLARGQTLREIRFGLGVAVAGGGIISMAVVVVGSAVSGGFSFEALAEALATRLGVPARHMLAVGLFAAGFSSAVTAPLAAALTARGLFASGRPERWSDGSLRYRTVWMTVLASGLLFGLSGVRPVPAILLAQALNGLLLPLVAIFLLLVVNDRALMGARGINGAWANAAMGICTVVTLVLGISKILGAGAGAFSSDVPGERTLLAAAAVVSAALAVPLWSAVVRVRRRS